MFGSPFKRRSTGGRFARRNRTAGARVGGKLHFRKLLQEPLEDRRLLSVAGASEDRDVAYAAGWADQARSLPFVPGEILIEFEGEVAKSYGQRGRAAALSAASQTVGAVGLSHPRILMDLPTAAGRGPRLVTKWDVPAGMEVAQIVDRLAGSAGIAYAEPNYIMRAAAVPNDPDFSDLWGLHNTGQTGGTADADIDAPEAWEITTGSGDIVIGVIDTGVDYTHVDLAANMWTNPGEVPDDGIDNDGNGYVDDVHGWDFHNDDADPFDDNGHGTHCSGTIAAAGNNSIGVVGVNWDAQIMALKFLDAGGYGSAENAVAALNYATMMHRDFGVNVRLTSNSWTGPFSQAIEDAVRASADAGMLAVAAAGNDSTDSPAYPAGHDLANILSVAATDHNDARASFSNFGATWVDLGAPGVDILSTLPGDNYGLAGGTSMAAPHVAGVAALLWNAAPTASPAVIKDAILDSVDPIPALSGVTVTGGRLNAYAALQEVGMTVDASSPADGEIVTSRPTDFVIDFAFPYDPATVQANDLEVNGTPAVSFTRDDADTVTFHYLSSPVAVEGPQTMRIPAGSLATTSGLPLDPLSKEWNAVFRYDALRMQASIDPAHGSLVRLPFTSLLVHFNEPYDSSTLGTDDLVLSQGTVTKAEVVDLETVKYTLDGLVNEGQLAVVMPAGVLTDLNGNPLLAHEGHLQLDFGTVPLPSPLEVLQPYGSLVYAATVDGTVSDSSDTDSFTLDLDAGQTITIVADPEATLAPAIALYDASSPEPIAASSGGVAGQDEVIQTVRLSSSGTYTVTVGGAAETIGGYSLQIVLNAAAEWESHDGDGNNTIASAQSIESAFIPLAGAGERAALLGTTDGVPFAGPDGYGYTAVSVPFAFEDISSTGTPVLAGADSDEALIKANQLSGFQFPFYGVTYGQVIVASNGTISFEWDRSGGTIYNGWFANGELTDLPQVATIAPFWDDLEIVGPDAAVYWEVRGEGADQRLLVQWHNVRIDGQTAPGDMIFQAVLYEADGSVQFNYLDIDSAPGGNDGAGYTVGIKDVGTQGPNRLLLAYDDGPNQWVGTGQSTRIGTGVAADSASDYYAFHMDQGDDLTLALTSLRGDTPSVEIQDLSGNTLATAAAGAANANMVVEQFVAPSTGDYYAVVSGQGGVEYSLMASRESTFDLEANNDFASAQDIDGRQIVLGSLAAPGSTFVEPGSGGLHTPIGLVFGQDGNLYAINWSNPPAVFRYNGATGAFIDIFASGGLTYGECLAFGPGGDLYAGNSGAGFGGIERFDGITGDYLGNFAFDYVEQPRGMVFGPDGHLYAGAYVASSIRRYDGTTGEYLGDFTAPGSGGLDHPWGLVFGPDINDDGVGDLVVASLYNGKLLRYDGANGQFIDELPPPASGPYGVVFGPDATGDDIPELYVGAGDVLRYDGLTGRFLDTVVPRGTGGMGSAADLTFGPDGSLYVRDAGVGGIFRFLTPRKDLYRLSLADGDTLDLATATPLGAGNGLDPVIRLYDSSRTLVASDDNSADGLNAQLRYFVRAGQAGTYYVEVAPADEASPTIGGEYVLTANVSPAAGPVLWIDDVARAEAAGGPTTDFVFTVGLLLPPGFETVSVDLATADGSAAAGSDYLPVAETLTFTPGQTSQTVTVSVIDDADDEGDETFLVQLSNPVGAVLGDDAAVGMIQNDDVVISIDDVSIGEGSDAVFAVRLSKATSLPVTVGFHTTDGTAKAPDDYAVTSGTLSFDPGQTTQTVVVSTVADAESEGAETFQVILENPTNARIGDLEAEGTLWDATVSYADFSDPSGLNLLSVAAITPGPDYALRLTPAEGGKVGGAWFTEKQLVSVDFETTFQFSLNEGSDAAGTDGSDGFAFVIQNDSADALRGGGGSLAYNGMPNSLAVEFDTWHNTELGDPSKSHISVHTRGIDPNSTDEAFSLGSYDTVNQAGFLLDNAQVHTATIRYEPGTMTILLDDLGPVLTVSVDLAQTLETDQGRAWVGFTAATGGGWQNHDILNWSYTPLVDTSTTIAVDDPAVLEGNPGDANQLVFTVTRAGQARDVTVDWQLTPGTATAGVDYDDTSVSGTLTIPQTQTSGEIRIPALADETEEPHDTLRIEFTNALGAILVDNTGVGTILNDETTISIDDVTASEGDATPRFIDDFVPQRAGGIDGPREVVFGPDANNDGAAELYVSNRNTNQLLRYDGRTGQPLPSVGNPGATFVAAGSGGLARQEGIAFGPDVNSDGIPELYVGSLDTNSILRYDGSTAAPLATSGNLGATFVASGGGGLDRPVILAFGPDANSNGADDLYVSSFNSDSILRYDGLTGEALPSAGNSEAVFVPVGAGGLDQPVGLLFGPDANGDSKQDLYVVSRATHSVLRYDGTSGSFIDEFVPSGSGGLLNPYDMAFHSGGDGNLYVTSNGTDSVLRYDGATGAFVDVFVSSGAGGLDGPMGPSFGSDGNLYLASNVTNEILRYGSSSQAVFTVSLSSPVGRDVMVDFATADGSAAATSDYVTTAGMLTFGADVTRRTILVPTIEDAVDESDEVFVVNLANPSLGATLGDDQGEATILDNDTSEISVTPTSGLATNEDGGSDTFTVVLGSQPTTNVVLSIVSEDPTEGTVSDPTLTFSASNWDQPQTVAVSGAEDTLVDGDVIYAIRVAVDTEQTGDANYQALEPIYVTVSNQDNDAQTNDFESQDVPKTIADPHPVKGLKTVTSELVIESTGITVDRIDVDLSIDHALMSDLTVTLTSPSSRMAALGYSGTWGLVDAAAFYDESLDGTWVLTVADHEKNGITGTLTAWSIAVTPLTGSTAATGEPYLMAASLMNQPSRAAWPPGTATRTLHAGGPDATPRAEPVRRPAHESVSFAGSVDAVFVDLDIELLGDELLDDLMQPLA